MIPVTCPSCSMRFQAPDGSGGKRAKCPNCDQPILIPFGEAAAAQPAPQPVQQAVPPHVQQAAMAAAAAAPAGAGGTTIVVQMQQPAAQAPAQTGMIGPENKSFAVVVLLWFIPLWGIHYYYLGQSGKGTLFLLLDLFLVGPLIFFTCGMGLVVAIPLYLLTLADALVVTGRIRKGPVSSWRFF
jgi:TM2 domain-containing membrane protein YozV